jgi:hypothetical protein
MMKRVIMRIQLLKKIDWYAGLDKYYKWDENKKEYTTNCVRICRLSTKQIKR